MSENCVQYENVVTENRTTGTVRSGALMRSLNGGEEGLPVITTFITILITTITILITISIYVQVSQSVFANTIPFPDLAN